MYICEAMTDQEKKTISVLIVDDHQMFIDGIKLLLKNNRNIQVVAEAHNGLEALEVISSTSIDLVITDINMPEMNGVELTKIIKKDFHDIKVLVLTMYNDIETVHEIIGSEAEGYILKNTGKQELINAINKIADNGTYYSNEVISLLSEKLAIKKTTAPKIDLTIREIEILQLICEENTTADIAKKLFISAHTVDTHRKHICQKIGTKTILGLMRYAIENNLLK